MYVNINHVCYSYGKIECFLKKNSQILCIIKGIEIKPERKVEHKKTKIQIKHILPALQTEVVLVIKPEEIIDKIIYFNGYVILRPNTVEETL